MFPAFRIQLAIPFLAFLIPASTLAQESKIEFDVPALVGVREILPSPFANSKIVEVLLPISTVIDSQIRNDVHEFRFDISWNRSVYPIFDYGPRTQTVTDVDGLLNIEESESFNSGINTSVNGKPLDLLSANISSDLGSGKSTRKTFQLIPQHELLVASGTIDRGTGAFFRFHGSKRDTLEGGRDLVLAYRVPSNWKNGLLKVECRASGSHRIAGLWDEPFEVGKSFIVPLYLDGDLASQNLAIDFARAEQGLRKSWIEFERKLEAKKRKQPFGFFTSSRKLPQQWPHMLIQSGDDDFLARFQNQLSGEVAIAAGKFVQVRNSLEAQ